MKKLKFLISLFSIFSLLSLSSVNAMEKNEFKLENKVDNKTNEIENKTNKVDNKTNEIENKTNEIENKTNKVDNKTNEIENKTNEIDNKTNKVDNKTNEIENKKNDNEYVIDINYDSDNIMVEKEVNMVLKNECYKDVKFDGTDEDLKKFYELAYEKFVKGSKYIFPKIFNPENFKNIKLSSDNSKLIFELYRLEEMKNKSYFQHLLKSKTEFSLVILKTVVLIYVNNVIKNNEKINNSNGKELDSIENKEKELNFIENKEKELNFIKNKEKELNFIKNKEKELNFIENKEKVEKNLKNENPIQKINITPKISNVEKKIEASSKINTNDNKYVIDINYDNDNIIMEQEVNRVLKNERYKDVKFDGTDEDLKKFYELAYEKFFKGSRYTFPKIFHPNNFKNIKLSSDNSKLIFELYSLKEIKSRVKNEREFENLLKSKSDFTPVILKMIILIYVEKKTENINDNFDSVIRRYKAYMYKDYDFTNLRQRFKSIMSTFTENEEDFFKKNFFDNKKYSEKFSDADRKLLNSINENISEKFAYSFGINNFEEINRDGIIEKLLDFVDKNEKINANIKDNGIIVDGEFEFFNVTKPLMMVCLDALLRDKTMRNRIFDLIKNMFKCYLTYNFVKMYGNKQDGNNSLISEWAKYFENLFMVSAEKNNFGLLELSLYLKDRPVKELKNSDYYSNYLNEIIKKFKDEKNWESARYERQIYRFFLTAQSFVNEKEFWNSFIGYFIAKHIIKVMETSPLDDESFSKECMSIVEKNEKLRKMFIKSDNKKSNQNEDFDTNKFIKINKELLGEKDLLFKRFIKVLELFEKKKEKKSFAYSMKNYLPDGGARYCKAFSYENFDDLMNDLINKGLKYSKKNVMNDNYSHMYGNILNNKKIANECISFIKYLFNRYVLYSLKYNFSGQKYEKLRWLEKNYDQNKNVYDKLSKKFIDIMKWYNSKFNVEVKDGKLNFSLNFEDCSIKKIEAIKELTIGLFENKDNFEFDDFCGKYEELFRKILYDLHLNVAAFLNSEDFWNEFMSDILLKKNKDF